VAEPKVLMIENAVVWLITRALALAVPVVVALVSVTLVVWLIKRKGLPPKDAGRNGPLV
jgi:hypothetical protein